MPGRSGSQVPSRDQGGEIRIAGQEAVDQGARPVPGTRMHHQAGRLVDHDHVVVGMDHREGHRGVGPGRLRRLGLLRAGR